MTTLSIDARHTPAAVLAMRPEDVRMQRLLPRLPPRTVIRVVRRAAGQCREHMTAHQGQEQAQAI